MKERLNVFISDEDRIMTTALKNDLQDKFGSRLRITVFNEPKKCLESIDDNTHLVIMAYDYKSKTGFENGLGMLKFIKRTHPLTEVILHSSNDDIRVILNSMKNGAKGYVVKKLNSFEQIRGIIRKRIMEPVRRIVTEFGVNKFVLIFSLVFLLMGVMVYIALKSRL
jgi:DNA-binding NtrC family response regulator